MNATLTRHRRLPFPTAIDDAAQVHLMVEEAVAQLNREIVEARVINDSTRRYVDRYRQSLPRRQEGESHE